MSLNEFLQVGNNLKRIRLELGLTQALMADKLGLKRSTYANYESNQRTPSSELLKEIASRLNISIEELLNTVPDLGYEERKSTLFYKVVDLVALNNNFDEIRETIDTVEMLKNEGSIKFNRLISKDDELEVFRNSLIANDRPTEISHVLAIKTSYNLTNETYLKYFSELVTKEIIDRISSILSSDPVTDDEYNEFDKIARVVIDTLGLSETINILDNSFFYIKEYITIEHNIEEIKEILYKNFSKLNLNIYNK